MKKINEDQVKDLIEQINSATTPLGYSKVFFREGLGYEGNFSREGIYALYSDNLGYIIKIHIVEEFSKLSYYIDQSMVNEENPDAKLIAEKYKESFKAYRGIVLPLLP